MPVPGPRLTTSRRKPPLPYGTGGFFAFFENMTSISNGWKHDSPMEGCDEELIRNREQYEEKEEPDGNPRGVCRKE